MKAEGVSLPLSVCRVLLINDNRYGLIARKALLEQAGYTTVIARTPQEGLTEFAAGHFDLVITDYKMPVMNGAELIQRLREIRQDARIILISGVAEVLGLNEQNTGADAVVYKSAHEVPHLLRAVNRLVRPSKAPRKPAAVQTTLRSPSAKVKLG